MENLETGFKYIKDKFENSKCCKFYKLILINLEDLENENEQNYFKQIN